MKKIVWACGISIVLAGSVSAQYTNTVYSEANDGMVEYWDGWAEATNHWENDSSEVATIGEWYGTNGLVCTVLPFQIPNLGIVTNPFAASSLQVFLTTNSLLTDVDLYFLGSDTNADIVASVDYYSGTNDTNSIMIEAGFITPATVVDTYLQTGAGGDSNLLAAMNDVYDGGAGAGDYVFLRLSYSSESWPTNTDSAVIHTRNYWGQDDWPVLTLESDLDSDNDGLPNAWEGAYGLDPNDDLGVNGATGDLDEDGISNTNEYVNGTFPNDADSDDDGLEDGDEQIAGTNPLNSDSDGDGLSDGVEVNTYSSYPLVPDSDVDGYEDGVEVAYGSSPIDAGENPGANGIVMDGALDSALYSLTATQTVDTAWGDNQNELNAAYTCVTNGRLYLMLAGNIETNRNMVEIFLDTTDAVQTNVLNTVDWENGQNLDGLTFDTGFEPDYHCFFRRDIGAFNLVDLATEDDSGYHGLFTSEGSAITGNGGNANDYSMEVAYSNANTGGVVAGTNAATANHWTNSLYGLELSIDLRDLGNPSGQIKMMAIINSSDRNYLSNQALAGLPAPYGSLENPTNVNFSAIAGDQFATADVGGGTPPSGPFSIGQISVVPGGIQINLGLIDLTVGATYKIQESTNLASSVGFTDVVSSGFTATNTIETVTVPTAGNARFFKAVSPQ